MLSFFIMIDLHTHSNCSDGDLSPEDLVKYAVSKKITVLALTDHDTISGLDRAEKASKENGIEFVRGIELGIEWPSGEFHLLGYGLSEISESLHELIATLQKNREERNLRIVEKLKDIDINTSLEELYEIFNTKNICRPHIADFLVSKKKVKNRQKAFDLYLAKGRPIYEKKVGMNLDVAIQAIKDSGGIPVLAHPLSLYVSWGKMEGVLQDLYERGICGLEAWHSGVRLSEAKRLEELARKLRFFVTAGSDFHGEKVRADRKIGHTAGGIKIDERFWSFELKPALKS
jgi:predicted metal-dependent phosphoesterase TrpH